MPFNDVAIRHEGDHYAVYIDGEFFCSADSYYEAAKEINEYALSL